MLPAQNRNECRTCLIRNVASQSLHKLSKRENFTLGQMLNAITTLNVQPGDGLSENVCNKCMENITEFFRFKQISERNEEMMWERLGIVKQPPPADLSDKESLVIEDDVSFEDNGFIICNDSNDGNVQIVVEKEEAPDEEEEYPEASEFVEEIDESMYEVDNSGIGGNPDEEEYIDLPDNYTDYEQIEEVVIDDVNEDYLIEEEFSDGIAANNIVKSEIYVRQTNSSGKKTGFHVTSNERDFVCKSCSGVFPTRQTLAAHRRLKNCLPADYHCNECDRYFKSATFLEAHLKVHIRNACFKCHERFNSNDELVEHLTAIHCLPFQCEVCQKGFRSKSRYSDHTRQHSGAKPYQCNICKQCFTASSTLKQHQLLHSDEKLFKCSYCTKAFSYRKTLIEHENTHTGNKPYKCNMCDASYSARGNLYAHRRTHTGEQPYSCNQCSKRFGSHNAWTKHMRVHQSGEIELITA